MEPNILLESGDDLENGGVDIEIGGGGEGLPLFHYFTVQLHLLCVQGKSKVPFIKF